MQEYDFARKLAFSRGVSLDTYPATIRSLLGPSCVDVRKAPLELDKQGVDWVAELRGGAEMNIDVKAREAGCSAYWKRGAYDRPEPELALETWSVMPDAHNPSGKIGWTLDESKVTDYTLHVFDPRDCLEVFLLPFQLLRMAFKGNFRLWTSVFRVAPQTSHRGSATWKSECVFVPASLVTEAIAAETKRHIDEEKKRQRAAAPRQGNLFTPDG